MAKYVVGLDLKERAPKGVICNSLAEAQQKGYELLKEHNAAKSVLFITGPVPDEWVENRRVSLAAN